MLLSRRPTAASGDCEDMEDVEDSAAHSEDLQAVLDLYHNDRIVEAYTRLSTLGLPPSGRLSNPAIDGILQDYEEVQIIFSSFQESNGWETVGSKGGITVHAKMNSDLPTISIMSEGEFDIPIERLLCLMYEADLYSEWVPFCKESRTLGNLTRVRKVIYQYFRLPVISDREIVMLGYGVNLLKHSGTLLAVAKSVPNKGDFKGVPLPPLNRDSVRAQVNFLGTLVRPLSRTRTYMQLITNFDPLVSGVPYKMLNWLSRKFARQIFKRIKKQAGKFEGSPHQQRMNSGEEFYRYINESLEEFFADNEK